MVCVLDGMESLFFPFFFFLFFFFWDEVAGLGGAGAGGLGRADRGGSGGSGGSGWVGDGAGRAGWVGMGRVGSGDEEKGKRGGRWGGTVLRVRERRGNRRGKDRKKEGRVTRFWAFFLPNGWMWVGGWMDGRTEPWLVWRGRTAEHDR